MPLYYWQEYKMSQQFVCEKNQSEFKMDTDIDLGT